MAASSSSQPTRTWKPLEANKADWECRPAPNGADLRAISNDPKYSKEAQKAHQQEQAELAKKLFRENRQKLRLALDREAIHYEQDLLKNVRIPTTEAKDLKTLREELRANLSARPTVVAIHEKPQLGPVLVCENSYDSKEKTFTCIQTRDPRKVHSGIPWKDRRACPTGREERIHSC
eukprot:TRINITY_DN19476_c0_g1_i1.p1 TRINITY_DN19476_c0_g1~~TRINITY_DN19476_c0_g1_i1.p1  ORF type:complete len:190 (+),score=23.60 TRINITY_DN19476_c0_g1_i1:41-571(+)